MSDAGVTRLTIGQLIGLCPGTLPTVHVDELSTPALLVDADAFQHNLAAMPEAHPGPRMRPHVKAHAAGLVRGDDVVEPLAIDPRGWD